MDRSLYRQLGVRMVEQFLKIGAVFPESPANENLPLDELNEKYLQLLLENADIFSARKSSPAAEKAPRVISVPK